MKSFLSHLKLFFRMALPLPVRSMTGDASPIVPFRTGTV